VSGASSVAADRYVLTEAGELAIGNLDTCLCTIVLRDGIALCDECGTAYAMAAQLAMWLKDQPRHSKP
jgi:hypothetical protein